MVTGDFCPEHGITLVEPWKLYFAVIFQFEVLNLKKEVRIIEQARRTLKKNNFCHIYFLVI